MAEDCLEKIENNYVMGCERIESRTKIRRKRCLPLSLKSTRERKTQCAMLTETTSNNIFHKNKNGDVVSMEHDQFRISSVFQVALAGDMSSNHKCAEYKVSSSENILKLKNSHGENHSKFSKSNKGLEEACVDAQIDQITFRNKDESLNALSEGCDGDKQKTIEHTCSHGVEPVPSLKDTKNVHKIHDTDDVNKWLNDDVTDWLNDDLEYDEVDLERNITQVTSDTTQIICTSSLNTVISAQNKQLSMTCPKVAKSTNTTTYKKPAINGIIRNTSQSSSCKKQTDIGNFFGIKPKKYKAAETTTPKVPNHEWKERRTMVQKKGNKKCPFYKIVDGTSFAVDAFSYGHIPGISHYFLSHFHYDHYGGLKKNFAYPIYCSQVTANLVLLKIKVASQFIHPLALQKPFIINNVEVTLLDANHCPGAVMFIFKLPNGKTHLHTGDFRASPLMETNPLLCSSLIHTVYLDTTYCDPAYSFPPQSITVDYCVSLASRVVAKNHKTLVVVGTYTIGKEKIFFAVAEALQCKVAVTRDKYNILQCLEKKHLNDIITQNYKQAQIHVLPMSALTHQKLAVHLKEYSSLYSEVLAIKPTGWTFTNQSAGSLLNVKPSKIGPVTIYGVPYSEHSSYKELERFVKFIKPSKILPTVNNGCATKREEMCKLFRNWLQ